MSCLNKYKQTLSNIVTHELYPWQKECLEIIRGNPDKSFLISAPTNSGKTTIAELFLFDDDNQHFTSSSSPYLFYTVPVKMLANQKFAEFSRKFPNLVALETGDIKINPPGHIMVICTQEIYTQKYAKQPVPGKVVIDEFHYVTERPRAYIDTFVVDKWGYKKYLLLSGTMPSINELQNYLNKITQSWRNESHNAFLSYQTNYRPSELVYTDQIYGYNLDHENNWTWVGLPDSPTIIYMFNKTLLKTAAQVIYNNNHFPHNNSVNDVIKELGINPEKYGRFWEWRHGIGVYHSQISYTEKKIIEKLTEEKYIKYLLATNAAGAGVNLPFAWVLFGGLNRKSKTGYIDIPPSEFTQMAGRAGRVGYYPHGFVGVFGHYFNRYEPFHKILETYQRLKNSPLEPFMLQLEPDYSSIIYDNRTPEEEIEYIRKYSLNIDENQIYEYEQTLRYLTDFIKVPQNLVILQDTYVPEIDIYTNINVAQLISESENPDISWILSYITDINPSKSLLLKRRFLKNLIKCNTHKFSKHDLTIALNYIEKEIEEEDPLLFVEIQKK